MHCKVVFFFTENLKQLELILYNVDILLFNSVHHSFGMMQNYKIFWKKKQMHIFLYLPGNLYIQVHGGLRNL